MLLRVFVDGRTGTTGLRILERLQDRKDLALVTLPDAVRKRPVERSGFLNSCHVAILCLPDDAAREAMAMIKNPEVRVIDASTAHRTAPGWVYGFPELSARQRVEIASSSRVANPGCHASGFIALVNPLVREGLLREDAVLSCHSITGYSGGGKQMIAAYEAPVRDILLGAPRLYGLGQTHKHLPEMTKIPGLKQPPIFCPVVAPFYSGMLVTLPLHRSQLRCGLREIQELYKHSYQGPVIRYADCENEAGFLSANALAGSDRMEILAVGSDERIVCAARFDNLGKGASGSAIQCLNLMIGADETAGLAL